MTPFLRSAAPLFGALALLTLAACVMQPAEPPPPPEPEPGPPTMDIWTAAAEGNIAELKANQHAGTDLDRQNPELQITPLTLAIVSSQLEAARWLLDNGANVNGLNGDGSTALNAAAFLGQAEGAKLLIDAGVDTSIRSYEGAGAEDLARLDWQTTEYIASMLQLPVDRATVEAGRAEIIAMITGSPSASASGGGWEVLAAAIINGDDAGAKAALGAGANPDAPDPNTGGTPLILAAFMGEIEIAKMLLAAGANINATNNDGANALTVAELDWETTEYIASLFQLPLTDPEGMKKGKAAIAKMLRAKM
ncbi:MAG: ankyrin repeat domain-containing protein [Gammaproteobacteria bacterium]|nr:ankyrin repeat domain-containing protein [Gammaproteobacteria bacterium]